MNPDIVIEIDEQENVQRQPYIFENIYYIYQLELSENPSFKVNYLVFEIDQENEENSFKFKINGLITSRGFNGIINCSPEILRDIKNLYYGIFDENVEKYSKNTENIKRENTENKIYGKLYINKDERDLDKIEFSYNNNNNDEIEMGEINNFDNILDKIKEDKLKKEEAAKEEAAKEEAAKEEAAKEEAAKEEAAKAKAQKAWFWSGGGKRKKQIKTKKLKK